MFKTRRSWSQVAVGSWFRSHLGFLFGSPGPRKSCSRLGAVLIFAKIADGAREPKIDPKMSPKSSPKPPPEASTWLKLSLQGGASFLSKCQLKFERCWDPKMENHSKICFGANWEPPGGLRGLQGPSGGLPEASGERFSSPECGFTASRPKKHGFGASKPS